LTSRHDFAATLRRSPQAKVDSRSGSGPNLNGGPAHLHRQVHSARHPGGDDADERGNRRRHQPKPDRLGLRADRVL